MNPGQIDPRMLGMLLAQGGGQFGGMSPTTPHPSVDIMKPAEPPTAPPQPVTPFDPSQFTFMGEGANGFGKFLEKNGATMNPAAGNGMQKGYYMPNSMMNLSHAG